MAPASSDDRSAVKGGRGRGGKSSKGGRGRKTAKDASSADPFFASDHENDVEVFMQRMANLSPPAEEGAEWRSVAGFLGHALKKLGGGTDDLERVNEAIDGLVETACELANALIVEGGTSPCRGRIDAAMQTLFYLRQSVSSSALSHRMLRLLGPGSAADGQACIEVSDVDLAAGMARFTPMGADDVNKTQSLLLYLFNTLQSRGLRRYNSCCYSKIYTEDGHDTHAWRCESSIADFVYGATRKELNFEHWMNLTSHGSMIGSVSAHLGNCFDVQFPALERDRHVFAFSNGLYLAADDRFIPYVEAEGRVPQSVAACKYFDLPFDATPVDDWYSDLPTPALQSILDHQELQDEVSRWVYVLLGRLIYEVNERDGWQVIPFLKGQAGTGKSTILARVCREMYEIADVGVLSNSVEKKFGLSAFCHKYLFIAPEIKADLGLEQAEFQSMVSGEPIQVAEKFKTATVVDWKVPGILAGNETPKWVDNSGSINRRIVLIRFTKKVTKGDMRLGDKLAAEMPRIMRKINMAYLQAVERCGANDVWKHLPAYFLATSKELAQDTCALESFLASGAIDVCENLSDLRKTYVPHKELVLAINRYCDDNVIKKQTVPQIRSMLESWGLPAPMKACLEYPIGSCVIVNDSFQYGITLNVGRTGQLNHNHIVDASDAEDPLAYIP